VKRRFAESREPVSLPGPVFLVKKLSHLRLCHLGEEFMDVFENDGIGILAENPVPIPRNMRIV
jgi:hypothetical protein